MHKAHIHRTGHHLNLTENWCQSPWRLRKALLAVAQCMTLKPLQLVKTLIFSDYTQVQPFFFAAVSAMFESSNRIGPEKAYTNSSTSIICSYMD